MRLRPRFSPRERRVFELVRRALGLLLGRRPERLRAHHDALAVAGEHEDIVLFAVIALLLRVEGLEVDHGTSSELLDLAFADRDSSDAADRLGGILKGASRRLERCQPTEPVRVALGRQVEHCVGGVQVLMVTLAIGKALDLHRAKDARKRAAVTLLDCSALLASGVDDAIEAALALGAQRQVTLQEGAQELAAVDAQALFELTVLKQVGLVVSEPADELRDTHEPTGKRTLDRGVLERRDDLCKRRPARCISRVRRQDFSLQRVSFAAQGAGIGDHFGHLRGRRWFTQRRLSAPFSPLPARRPASQAAGFAWKNGRNGAR